MIFIRQQDSMQCGIACLAMICRNYGKKYTIDALSDICFPTTEGVSLLGISHKDFLALHFTLESKPFCSIIQSVTRRLEILCC